MAPFAEHCSHAAGPREHYDQGRGRDGTEGRLRLCHGSGYSSLLGTRRGDDRGDGGDSGAACGSWTPCPLRGPSGSTTIAEVPEFDLLKIDVQGSRTGRVREWAHGDWAGLWPSSPRWRRSRSTRTSRWLDAQMRNLGHDGLPPAPVHVPEDRQAGRRGRCNAWRGGSYASQLIDAGRGGSCAGCWRWRAWATRASSNLVDPQRCGLGQRRTCDVLALAELARRGSIGEARIDAYVDLPAQCRPARRYGACAGGGRTRRCQMIPNARRRCRRLRWR